MIRKPELSLQIVIIIIVPIPSRSRNQHRGSPSQPPPLFSSPWSKSRLDTPTQKPLHMLTNVILPTAVLASCKMLPLLGHSVSLLSLSISILLLLLLHKTCCCRGVVLGVDRPAVVRHAGTLPCI